MPFDAIWHNYWRTGSRLVKSVVQFAHRLMLDRILTALRGLQPIMHRAGHWERLLTAATVFLFCFSTQGVCSPKAGNDNGIILTWNRVLIDAIRGESTAPSLFARNAAIMHLSIYDAVEAVTKEHEVYAFDEKPETSPHLSATAIGAAHRALTLLYPSRHDFGGTRSFPA